MRHHLIGDKAPWCAPGGARETRLALCQTRVGPGGLLPGGARGGSPLLRGAQWSASHGWPIEGMKELGTRGVTFALCIFFGRRSRPACCASPPPDELFEGVAKDPNWVRRLLYPLPAAPLNSLRPGACGQGKAGAFGPGRVALPVLPGMQHHSPHAPNASGARSRAGSDAKIMLAAERGGDKFL